MEKHSTSQITILGSGTSTGVPQPLCLCSVCQSLNPKNKRMRSSLYFQEQGLHFLIDTTPDLARQAQWMKGLDYVFISHCHADHLNGLDDLRSFNFVLNKKIPIYTTFQNWEIIEHRFDYLFKKNSIHTTASIEKNILLVNCYQKIENTSFYILDLPHGEVKTLGFIFNKWAYLIDFNFMPENYLEKLLKLDLLIIDCVRLAPHKTHLNLEASLKIIEKIKPKKALLTHMSHDFDYESLKKSLPFNVEPAFDGLTIEI